MEERNRNKRFRIESVYYESSMLKPRDDYSQEQYEEIADLVGKWSSFDFDKTDAYIYFDDLEKELFPSALTSADRKRFIDYLKKEIEAVNG
ncbi:glycine reductase [Ligilactobacillus ruminis]|uniref:glycine reductase n=1 Tax=Ligilactobacillus ruminis TaxID=1623 RepID=UPI0022E27239|nr:glycine reductase [Ligilactobacillus ruminis]